MRPPPLLQLFRGFLPSLRVLSARVSPFIADSFLPFLCRPFRPIPLSPMYSATYINVHDCLVLSVFLFFLLLFDSYSVFPDFFISSFRSFLSILLWLPLPLFFFISFFYASIFMHRQSIHVIDSLIVSTITSSLFNFLLLPFIKIFILHMPFNFKMCCIIIEQSQ